MEVPSRQKFECVATLVTRTTAMPPPPLCSIEFAQPPFRSIVLELSCEFTIARWVLQDEDKLKSLVSENQQPAMRPIVIPISLGDIYFSYEKVYAIIQESIRHWPGEYRDHQNFIIETLEHGLVAVESMAESDHHVFVHMHMKVKLHQFFEVSRDYNDDVADDSSSEICTVCLKELSDQGCGGVISKLPCLHVFHQDCIEKWLGVRRFCPNCRFKVPKMI